MNNFKTIFASFTFILLAINSSMAQIGKAKEIGALMNREYQLGNFNGNVLVVEKGNILYQSELAMPMMVKKQNSRLHIVLTSVLSLKNLTLSE